MPTYFITCANRGLGLEFVAQLSQQSSNNIIPVSRFLSPNKLKDLESLKSKDKNIHILECDTSSWKSITSFAVQITSLLGPSSKVLLQQRQHRLRSSPNSPISHTRRPPRANHGQCHRPRQDHRGSPATLARRLRSHEHDIRPGLTHIFEIQDLYKRDCIFDFQSGTEYADGTSGC
jgi:hypothetical protein